MPVSVMPRMVPRKKRLVRRPRRVNRLPSEILSPNISRYSGSAPAVRTKSRPPAPSAREQRVQELAGEEAAVGIGGGIAELVQRELVQLRQEAEHDGHQADQRRRAASGTSWRRTRITITITMPTTSTSVTAVSMVAATSFLERSRW